jgi:hypothetical protein
MSNNWKILRSALAVLWLSALLLLAVEHVMRGGIVIAAKWTHGYVLETIFPVRLAVDEKFSTPFGDAGEVSSSDWLRACEDNPFFSSDGQKAAGHLDKSFTPLKRADDFLSDWKARLGRKAVSWQRPAILEDKGRLRLLADNQIRENCTLYSNVWACANIYYGPLFTRQIDLPAQLFGLLLNNYQLAKNDKSVNTGNEKKSTGENSHQSSIGEPTTLGWFYIGLAFIFDVLGCWSLFIWSDHYYRRRQVFVTLGLSCLAAGLFLAWAGVYLLHLQIP